MTFKIFKKSHSHQNMELPNGVAVQQGVAPGGGAVCSDEHIDFQPDQVQAGGFQEPQDVNLSSVFMPFIKNYVSNLSHNKSPTKLPYPPNFYYPASSLMHQMNLQMNHINLLLQANTLPTPQDRFLAVLKYSLSTCSLTKFPYKPIISFLGETQQSFTTHSMDGVNTNTTYYLGEQVEKEGCAFYICNPAMGVVHEGSVAMVPKFKQAHVHVEFQGNRRTILSNPQGGWNEVYVGDVPDLNIRLLRMHTELGGQFNLVCETTGFAATVQFKDKPIFGGVKNGIAGKVTFQGRELFQIEGTWDEVAFLVDSATKTRFELFNRTATPKMKVETPSVQLPTSGEREWGPMINTLHQRDFEQAKILKAQLDATHHERLAQFEANGGFLPTTFTRRQGEQGFWIKDPNLVLTSGVSGAPSM